MEGFEMSINVELIDELRKRAKVSYEDAKEALEKNNGDLVEALIYLEKQNKVKTECGNSFISSVKKIIKKGNRIKFIIKKQESTILSLPLTAAVIITIVAPYVTVIGLIVAIFTGHRIRFQGENGEDMKINKTVDKVTDIVGDLTKE
jgi:hypothetical protein